MRTRRSPRNQDRLWRSLGGPPKPAPPKRTPLVSRAEARRLMFKDQPAVHAIDCDLDEDCSCTPATAAPDLYIRFTSHRAREYGLRLLDRKPQGYWSLRRRGHGGIYLVTAAEIARLQGQHLVRFTRLRGPYADLHACWGD